MTFEPLKTVVLLGEGVSSSSLMDILSNLPQLEIMGQVTSPEDVLSKSPESMPDLVIVDLEDQKTLPEWLPKLNQSLPQSTVMVCSHNRDPDFLIHVIKSGVREFLPLPLHFPDLESALERLHIARKQLPYREAVRGRIIVVTGLKGGMGVTSVAVNLAVSLAATYPKRVLLVDMGRPFPDVANFLDQKRSTCILDLVEHSEQLEVGFVLKTLHAHPHNFSVLHGCYNPELIDHKALGKVWDTLRPLFEWTVVDLSHAPDNVTQQTLKDADHVLLIIELLVPTLENLKRWWQQYEEWQLDRNKVKVIVNRYQKNEGVDLEDLRQLQHHPVYYTLPNDYLALSDCINHGVPLKELAPRSKLCRALEGLAEELASFSPESGTGQAPPRKKRRWFWFF